MFNIPSDERKDFLVDELIISEGMANKHKIINVLINAIVASAVWTFTKNIMWMGIAFVLFDIVANFAEVLVMRIFVKKKSDRTLEEMEAIYNKALKDFDKYEKELDQRCRHCGEYNSYSSMPPVRCKAKQPCSRVRKYVLAQRQINYYGPIIENKREQLRIQQEELEKQQRLEKSVKSQDYEDKMQYFDDLLVKVEFYEEEGIDILVPIHKSIDALIDILKKKPSGLEFVPNSTYIYLDEVVSIMSKYIELDEERRDVYKEQISTIADILSRDISLMIDRIQNSEEADIDVSIAVLMTALKNKEDK